MESFGIFARASDGVGAASGAGGAYSEPMRVAQPQVGDQSITEPVEESVSHSVQYSVAESVGKRGV